MSGILQQAQATAGPSASSTPNGAKRLSATLLVPTLNEREGLEVVLPQIDPGWVDDILFVDGGSTDGTLEVIRRWGHGRLLVQTRPGLSNAYLEALARIASDIVVTFSPDGNSLPEAIPALVEKMRQGYDLVIASRYLPGAGSQDDDPVTAFGNWIFTRVINLLFGGRYTDSLVILRAYRRGLIEDLGLVGQTRKFEPEPLLSIRCAVHKKRVAEIPAKEPRRIGGIRKMNPLVNGWAIVVLIVREWFRTFRRKKRMSTTSTLRSLTQEEIRLYKENGYLVVNDLFSSEECDQILATCKARTDEKFSAILNLDRQVPAVREVMKSPKIVHIIETLQGAEVVGLMSQILFKEAGSPYASQAWNPHQDNAYPQAPDGAYITINLFLGDADPENGGMYIYPGSHKEGTLPFEPTISYREKTGTNPGNTCRVPPQYTKVDLVVPKGGMLIMNSNVIHGSYPNRSATRSRPLFSISYLTKGQPFVPGNTAKREEIPLH